MQDHPDESVVVLEICKAEAEIATCIGSCISR